jgi:hypothetical protein
VTQPVGQKFVTGLALDRSDNNRMYWMESVDIGPSKGQVLYTAPISRNAQELAAQGGPRKLLSFGDGNGKGGVEMFANAGLAADMKSWQEAVIVRGSDGKGWTIAAEPNEHVVKVFWIDDEEIWISTAPMIPNVSADEGVFETGMMVISRASLGPATTLPNL